MKKLLTIKTIILLLSFPISALAETKEETILRLMEMQIRMIEEVIILIVELMNKLVGY